MTRMLIVGAGLATVVAAGEGMAGAAAEMTAPNPLLAKRTGPYGGVPQFDKFKVEQFKPALEPAMAEQPEESDKIAQHQAPPDLNNTIAAMERPRRAPD